MYLILAANALCIFPARKNLKKMNPTNMNIRAPTSINGIKNINNANTIPAAMGFNNDLFISIHLIVINRKTGRKRFYFKSLKKPHGDNAAYMMY
jgi:hypothetical protein